MLRILSGPLTVESHQIRIRDLPAELSGTVVVQLSDFHFDGLRLSTSMLTDVQERIEAIAPDLIVLTGDYVTDDPNPIHELVRYIKQLPSRLGMLAVLGNHDIQQPGARKVVTEALEKVNIPVLWNAIATPFGDAFPIVGLADYWSREFDLSILRSLNPQTPRLVLSHNPDTAALMTDCRVDLQLSGHTHGGQVYIPGIGPGPYVWQQIRNQVPAFIRNQLPFLNDRCFHVTRHWEWCQGLHQVGENWLYVNRGLGTYLPGRFFCPPELTVLTLEAA